MVPSSAANFRPFLLLVLLCGFLFFHFHTIELEDYWPDEMGSYQVAKLPNASSIWEHLKYTDNHPPLYFLTLRYFIKFAEPKGINLRWLSVFWALVAMGGLYFWMQWAFGKEASFLSFLLLAVNPFWLAYCQELRMYTMYPGFLWWGAGVLILAVRTKGRIWWLISAILNSAALWVHYHAAFFILAEIVALWIFAVRTRQQSLRSQVLFFFCFIIIFSFPLLGIAISQTINSMYNIAWLPSPEWYGLFTCFFEAYFIYIAASIAGGAEISLRYAAPLFFILVILALSIKAKKKGLSSDFISWSSSSFAVMLLITTAFLPVCLMFFLSFSPVKFFLPWRYIILGLGPFLGLIALLLSSIRLPFLRYAFIFYLVFIAGFSNWLLVEHKEKPDWKTLAGIIDENVKEQDVLVFPPQHWGNAYLYYSSKKRPSTAFHDLILQQPHGRGVLYHLSYNYSRSDDPFYPWIVNQFMDNTWRHAVLFDDPWYTFTRYEDVDFSLLKRWYLRKGIWEKGEIARLNPVGFKCAGDLAVSKHRAHFAPLELDRNQEVYCWMHSPPVPICLRGEFSEGEYLLRLKAGIGFFPKSPPYTLSMSVEGRGVAKWEFDRKGVYDLVAQFHQAQATEKIGMSFDGDWCCPAEFDPNSPDKRKLLIHFYWLAVTKNKPQRAQK